MYPQGKASPGTAGLPRCPTAPQLGSLAAAAHRPEPGRGLILVSGLPLPLPPWPSACPPACPLGAMSFPSQTLEFFGGPLWVLGTPQHFLTQSPNPWAAWPFTPPCPTMGLSVVTTHSAGTALEVSRPWSGQAHLPKAVSALTHAASPHRPVLGGHSRGSAGPLSPSSPH